MTSYYDAHCHLDFASEEEAIAQEAQAAGMHALCSTVLPSAYVSAQEHFEGLPDIRAGLGVHPWWVDDHRISEVDLDRFENLVEDAPFIGEVGLDFSGRRKGTRDWQIEVFERLMRVTQQKAPGKPIFLHAVKSTEVMLDILEDLGMLETNPCVLHWFQGNHEQFGRAVSKGVRFSCSMRMIAREGGDAIVRAVPAELLLAETDSPAHEGSDWSWDTWRQEIDNTVRSIADVRGCTTDELTELIAGNYQGLVASMEG